MRRYLIVGLLLAALAIPATAAAAILHEPHQNSKCPVSGVTGWHFVNNQYGNANPANVQLTAVFSTGTIGPIGSTKWNNGTIHWTVFTPSGATLITAQTTIGGVQVAGNLVLSDCFKK
jgi:hypothetical protein